MLAQVTSPRGEAVAGPAAAARRSIPRTRTIVYWIVTLVLTFENVAGSTWDLLRIEYVRSIQTHLGYPLYLLTILGVWKLASAAAIVAPGFLRLKEWAYAGSFFVYSGAVASHVLAGDGPDRFVAPAVFATVTIASWATRPSELRLPSPKGLGDTRPPAWAAPLGLILLMLVVSFLTLPLIPQPN
jgi:hypothetical protein